MSVPAQATTIYVALLDEGTEAWRPVPAEHVSEDVYRITAASPDHDDEKWEFMSGELVRCRQQQLSDGEYLVAYASAGR